MSRLGIVRINQQMLLDFLDLSLGKIRHISMEGGVVCIEVEHPEFPDTNAGIPVISPSYTRYSDNQGRWVAIRNPVTPDQVYPS
jgi:hypothetical protein